MKWNDLVVFNGVFIQTHILLHQWSHQLYKQPTLIKKNHKNSKS